MTTVAKLVLGMTLLLSGFLAAPSQSFGTALDFEALNDGDVLTTQLAGQGAVFTNTTVLTSDAAPFFGTLNTLEFPPHSGVNVVVGDAGAVTIDFAPFVVDVGGFFTYAMPLTLTAFDASLSPVATDVSQFSANLADIPGSIANEFLGVTFASGIARLTIVGDPASGQFTLDDLTFTPVTNPVPEPATDLLVGLSLVGLLGYRVCRSCRSILESRADREGGKER